MYIDYEIRKKKYKKILSLKKKFNFNEFDLITNYGLFSGDTNLYKTLKIYDLIKNVENVKGDIIELGIFQGNLSLLIKKILYIFKIKKIFSLAYFDMDLYEPTYRALLLFEIKLLCLEYVEK